MSWYGDRPSGMKKPPDLNTKDMDEFQKKVYDLMSEYVKGDNPDSLFMCCGVMLKTCIEMYTSVLTIEAVHKVLLEAIRSIPELSERVENELKKITMH